MGLFDKYDSEIAEDARGYYAWLRGAGNDLDREHALELAEAEAEARQRRKDQRKDYDTDES